MPSKLPKFKKNLKHPAHQLLPRVPFTKSYVDWQLIYKQPPQVYDGLACCIQRNVKSSRTIKLEDERGNVRWFELWSPNSRIVVFYPGMQELPGASVLPRFSYPDGRLGPNDWTLHPQHFDSDRPWLGFCVRQPSTVQAWSSVDPEFVPLPLVYVPSQLNMSHGHLDHQFGILLHQRTHDLRERVMNFQHAFRVLKRGRFTLHKVLEPDFRPQYPSLQDIDILTECRSWSWEELLPLFKAAQRGLCEMQAWLTMMEVFERLINPSALVPSAAHEVDRYVGVFLNGATETEILWLLAIQMIPLYIVHEFIEGIDFNQDSQCCVVNPDRRAHAHSIFTNFVTDIDIGTSHNNDYFSIFSDSNRSPQLLPFSTEHLQRPALREPSLQHRINSASWDTSSVIFNSEGVGALISGYRLQEDFQANHRIDHEDLVDWSDECEDMEITQSPHAVDSQAKLDGVENTSEMDVDVEPVSTSLASSAEMPSSSSLHNPALSDFVDGKESQIMAPPIVSQSTKIPAEFQTSLSPKNLVNPRIFEKDVLVSGSPHVYCSCHIPDSKTLALSIERLCNQKLMPSQLVSIDRDVLFRQGFPMPGYLVRFEDTIHAARVCTMLQRTMPELFHYIFITELGSIPIISHSQDQWIPESSFLHSNSASRGISLGLPKAAMTSEEFNGMKAKSKAKPNNNRGGIRLRLIKRFKRDFWDIAHNLSPEEFASLSEVEQQYILRKCHTEINQ